MADNIVLKTWAGELNTALHDAIIRDTMVQMSGIFRGCGVSYTSGNTIHIAAGYGMIKGRLFEIYDSTLQIALPASGTYKGRIYIHMDLGNADEPITLLTATASALPELVKDENCNFDNGIYELELDTFTATPLEINNIAETAENINGVLKRLLYTDYLELPGYQDSDMTFPEDGSILTTYKDGSTARTVFNADGTIADILQMDGVTIATKITSFPADGSVRIRIEEE